MLLLAGSIAPGTLRPVALPVGAAATPPLGWNSWNGFGCDVSDALIRQTADALVSSRLRDAGYRYLTIDDCWMAPQRTDGHLVPDPAKFPHGLTTLADYVHARGLRFGLYESAGTRTCAGYPGSLDHETSDARDFAAWGVDYLKYDNCFNGGRPAGDRYATMADALRRTGRPIVLSLCEWGENAPWSGWGARAGGSLWRTTADISDTWTSVLANLAAQVALPTGRPNAWNDPDMLEVGNGGMDTGEYRAQFSLWAVLNAPLIAGNDVRRMTAATRDILLNREVLTVDQDWSGRAGRLVRESGPLQVWAKPMTDGSVAVVFLNVSDDPVPATASAAELGLKPGPRTTHDLWTGANTTGPVRATVAPHDVVMLRVT
ncbi:glycoside hydrolase family 27 protein [Cryptosporangium phraense]|uniref:Alpha-galactosidase n=1 Tax=Cryptosporangium phraense TaxID=2593070 RepID=A0A545B0M1_9ACTN|nr:glycoside hydrolase family 27 protein [Cryptosporangium phraense]